MGATNPVRRDVPGAARGPTLVGQIYLVTVVALLSASLTASVWPRSDRAVRSP
jgi:hypothetical protein